MSGTGVSGVQNMSVGQLPVTVDLDPMMTGFTPDIEKRLTPIYRDMYYNDAVCGSAIDLMSILPFSEFSLGGVEDNKVLGTFNEVLERLATRTMLPEISVDYLATGAHCSSLLFNSDTKMFTDVMPHAVDTLEIQNLPFYSMDPILTVQFPDAVKSVLSASSSRIDRIRKRIGNSIFEKIRSGRLELDPVSTIYIPRKTFSTTDIGVSYLRRVLPIYLIEKNLYRGTLVESARRQRGILHIMLGDGSDWDPTPADMEFITDLFMNADSDPIGAIVATKMGVSVNELRQGGDFWKVTDFQDSVLNYKLRALGISEGFLSGEANYSTADTSLTVFIDMLKAYRDLITRKFFYDKLFPMISIVNGFAVNSKGKMFKKEFDLNDTEDILFNMNDGSKLLIPTISWAKQLKPEGNTQVLEMLDKMSQAGIPVPLRVMAAAGDMNLDDLLRQQDEDLKMRKMLNEYMTKIKELSPQQPTDGEISESSSLIAMAKSMHPRGSVLARSGGRIPLLSRDFGELGEIKGETKTGKAKFIHNQTRANRVVNEKIAKAAAKIHKTKPFDTVTKKAKR